MIYYRTDTRQHGIYLLNNRCHKVNNLGGPLGHSLFCVILTISYLWACTIETSSLPIDSSRPLFKQIEIFYGIPTAHFNCTYFPIYTCQRALGWDILVPQPTSGRLLFPPTRVWSHAFGKHQQPLSHPAWVMVKTVAAGCWIRHVQNQK